MKKTFSLLLFLLTAVFLAACQPGPVIEAETTSFDLGEVVNGEIVRRQVTIYNRGSAPLKIEGISTSCSCTTAKMDEQVIPPGGSSQLEIAFDAGAHGPALSGSVLRQVFVASNDADNPEIVIEFTADIVPGE